MFFKKGCFNLKKFVSQYVGDMMIIRKENSKSYQLFWKKIYFIFF